MPNGQADLGALSYIALKPMQVSGVTKNIGDAIPEAATWRNLSNYISAGMVGVVGLATGGHAGVPGGKALRTKVGRPEGNKDYTHYRPTSPDGVPSKIPSDAT